MVPRVASGSSEDAPITTLDVGATFYDWCRDLATIRGAKCFVEKAVLGVQVQHMMPFILNGMLRRAGVA